MCSKLADNIVTFNVSGVPIKITTEKLASQPESWLTIMVHNKVQPAGGWFVECCPKIFGYILRFLVYDIKIDASMVAGKIGATEPQVRKIIDGFALKGVYVTDMGSKSEGKEEEVTDGKKEEVKDGKKEEMTDGKKKR